MRVPAFHSVERVFRKPPRLLPGRVSSGLRRTLRRRLETLRQRADRRRTFSPASEVSRVRPRAFFPASRCDRCLFSFLFRQPSRVPFLWPCSTPAAAAGRNRNERAGSPAYFLRTAVRPKTVPPSCQGGQG